MGQVLLAAIAAAEQSWRDEAEARRREFEDACERLLGPDLAADMGLVFEETEELWCAAFYWAHHEWRLWRTPGGRWHLARMAPGAEQALLDVPVPSRRELLIELADGAASVSEEPPRSPEQRLLDLLREVVRRDLDFT